MEKVSCWVYEATCSASLVEIPDDLRTQILDDVDIDEVGLWAVMMVKVVFSCLPGMS